ncbi:unnamed protein product, partial [marine sediment metagenome]
MPGNGFYTVNTDDGIVTPRTGFGDPYAYEIIDYGLWWKVCCSAANTSSASGYAQVIGSVVLSGGDPGVWIDNGAYGSAIFGNVEIHLNKTIAEVRGLGPIFTTTAAAATDVTVYRFDLANFERFKSAWYVEYVGDYSSDSNSVYHTLTPQNFADSSAMLKMDPSKLPDSSIYSVYTNTSAANAFVTWVGNVPLADDVLAKTAINYFDTSSEYALACNGVWDTTYVNFLELINYTDPINVGARNSTQLGTAKWRNIRRYDTASFAEGKGIIDDLM